MGCRPICLLKGAAEYDKAPEKEIPPVVNAVRLAEGVSSK